MEGQKYGRCKDEIFEGQKRILCLANDFYCSLILSLSLSLADGFSINFLASEWQMFRAMILDSN